MAVLTGLKQSKLYKVKPLNKTKNCTESIVTSAAANCILLVSRQAFERREAAKTDKERTNCFLNKNTVF